MTKEEIKQLETQIKSFIKTLDQYSNEDLVHYYKCALGRNTSSKGLYTPLIKAIEQIRQKKGFVIDVSAKGVMLEKTNQEIKMGNKIQYKNKKGVNKWDPHLTTTL